MQGEWEGASFSCSRFWQESFQLFSISIILSMALSKVDFIMLRYVPSTPTMIRVFIMNGCWIFQMIFQPLLRWSCGFWFFFCLCGVLITLSDCVCSAILVNLGWIPLGHGVWSFLMCYWIGFAKMLLRIFASIFIKGIGL